MPDQFARTRLLLGEEAVQKLHDARVIVFGIGGVGGFTAEALVRAGIGAIDIVDNDKISLTNINRQIIAVHSTVGKYKVDVMADRILDINPDCKVVKHQCFFLPETAGNFDFSDYTYVVDAVDTVAAKIAIIESAKKTDVPVISCMGAGNKLDPSKFTITDISRTSVCPLARVMRQELKKRRIEKVKVLFSTEKPAARHVHGDDEQKGGHTAPGSISFVPSVAGLIIAGEVIREIAGVYGEDGAEPCNRG